MALGPTSSQPTAAPKPLSMEQRKARLAQQIAQDVAAGARIESQGDTMAVLVKGKPVNHILHFLLGFPTVGIWWLTAWPMLAIFGGEKRNMLQIDDYGNVLRQKA